MSELVERIQSFLGEQLEPEDLEDLEDYVKSLAKGNEQKWGNYLLKKIRKTNGGIVVQWERSKSPPKGAPSGLSARRTREIWRNMSQMVESVGSLDEATKKTARDAAGLLAFVAKNPKNETSEEDLKEVREFLQFASKSTIAAFLTFFWKNML